jgi:tetratricopeptide (TPR) repeat protein/SAM-dependent methyltransferase
MLAKAAKRSGTFSMANPGTDAVLANWAVETLLKEANQHFQSGDMVRAEQLCRHALSAEPCASDAWHLLAVALTQQSRLSDSALAAQRAIDLLPGNPTYWVTRGIVDSDQNLLQRAQECFRHAVRLNPKLYEAYYLLGKCYHRAYQPLEAIAAYRKALRGRPEVPEIHFHLARALLQTDRVREALAAFEAAFARDREGRLDRGACIECFGKVPLKSLPAFWQNELTRFFNRQGIDKTRYSAGALYVLMSKPAFQTFLEAGSGQERTKADLRSLSPVMHDTLFGILLRDAVIGHPQFEAALTWLRSRLLLDGALRAQAPLQFLSSLALQCFNNEFVYAESQIETGKIAELSREIEHGLASRGPYGDRFMRSLTVLGMYRPLYVLPGAETLLAEVPSAQATAFMLSRMLDEPLKESRLRSNIPAIGEIANPVSREVRAQYEESPYPRWIAFDSARPTSFSSWMAGELPGLSFQRDAADAPNILVAGCGTGLEAISLAAKIGEARITAVDLSLSSLAYAKRKASELGLANIEFLQADILELGGISERFDAIISAGVLHHMREPREGLRVLVRLAQPGGLIKIGLYSQRARSGVNAVRKLISERKLMPSVTAIKTIRKEVLGSSDPVLSSLLRWRDFYTMSECRDLLFHVEEHQFTLPQIADMLRSEELTVMGVSKRMPNRSIQAYRRMAPQDENMDDLRIWDAVEAQLPDTFEGMYIIWCRTLPSLPG